MEAARKYIRRKSGNAGKGFSLLEVLYAVTIFAMVASALYTTFRVGIRSYEIGEREIRRMQHVRVIFDTLTRDLRCVYYRPETEYNEHARQVLREYERKLRQAEQEGELDEFLYGEDGDEEDINNPYKDLLQIDLGFKGEDGEEKDSMSFVRYQYDTGLTDIQPWAMGRIEYFVEDGSLYRAEEDIIEPMKDIDGEPIEEKIPRYEELAKGVRKFDLSYGFFYNGDWMEAPDWDSEEKQYRNPAEEIFEDDPDYYEKLQRQERKPPDGVPAFIRVELDIADLDKNQQNKSDTSDSGKKERVLSYSTVIRIPTAMENYRPSLEEDEDDDEYR